MRITKLLAPFVLVIFFFGFISCKSNCAHVERIEGFKDDCLRVYVRVYLPDDYEEETIENISGSLLKHGKNRAINLLESHIKISLNDKEMKDNAIKKAPDALKDAKIACNECNDEYCEAFIDFNIKGLKDMMKIKTKPSPKDLK